MSRANISRSTVEGLRIAGITSLADIITQYAAPAGSLGATVSGAPRPKPPLGSRVAFSPGACSQLPVVFGGSAPAARSI